MELLLDKLKVLHTYTGVFWLFCLVKPLLRMMLGTVWVGHDFVEAHDLVIVKIVEN